MPDNQAVIEAQRLLHQNPLLVDTLIACQVVASVEEAGQAMTELVIKEKLVDRYSRKHEEDCMPWSN